MQYDITQDKCRLQAACFDTRDHFGFGVKTQIVVAPRKAAKKNKEINMIDAKQAANIVDAWQKLFGS